MSGSSEQFTRIAAPGACARTVETRQTLGAEAFAPPSAEQSRALWQNFHRTHPGLNSNLDAPTRAALTKLETAALDGNAQSLAEVVKASQHDASADGALKAFQREITALSQEARTSGNNLFTQPDGKLARLSIGGGRVQMLDTGDITLSLSAHATAVDECGKTQDGKPNSELRTLSLRPDNAGEEPISANRIDRFGSEPTDPAAFFNKFSPILQNELEHEANGLL